MISPDLRQRYRVGGRAHAFGESQIWPHNMLLLPLDSDIALEGDQMTLYYIGAIYYEKRQGK